MANEIFEKVNGCVEAIRKVTDFQSCHYSWLRTWQLCRADRC